LQSVLFAAPESQRLFKELCEKIAGSLGVIIIIIIIIMDPSIWAFVFSKYMSG
jgi:hypothetical protein